jgi:hypothetical protein
MGGLVDTAAGGTTEGPLILTGVVVDPTGRPVADARVALASSPVEVPDVAGLTGEDGAFSLAVPVPGVYRVAAFADQGRAEVTTDVTGEGAGQVRMVLRP